MRTLRDALRERGALHELQHERAYAVRLFEAVNMRDVRMIEGGECFRFTLEAREPFGVVRERVRQNLQGDITIQLRVAGAINLAHATGGGSYQTLINAALREYVGSKREPLEATLRRVLREELPRDLKRAGAR